VNNHRKTGALPPWLAQLETRLRQGLPGPGVMRTVEPPLSHGRHFHRFGPPWPPAAVAVLLCQQAGRWGVPLVVRPRSMPHHGGQVGLPGGLLQPGEDPCQGALRELEEELGIVRAEVRCLGALTPLRMFVSRLQLQPWLCAAAGELAFRPDRREVEKLLFLPLKQLCSPQNRRTATRELFGVKIEVPGWSLGEHFIWGATALVLAEVAAVLNTCGFADQGS